MKPRVPVVLFGILQGLASRHLAEVVGKVDARGKRQIERSPKLGVDLYQLVVVVAQVITKLHHGYAVPFEPIEQASPVLLQLRVVETLRTATDPSARRSLPDPPVHEGPLANSVLIQRKEPTPVSGNELLHQGQPAAAAVPSAPHRPEKLE